MVKRLIAAFVSGILLLNAVPHLVQGICGESHMTPFGVESSAAVNVIWAWVNLIIGGLILKLSKPKEWTPRFWVAFSLGGFVLSLSLAFFWSNHGARLPW